MSAGLALLSTDQLYSMLDRMAEGVLFIAPDGRIFLANAASRRLLGLPDGSIIGTRVWDYARSANFQELVERVLETNQPQMREVTVQGPEERIVQAHVMSADTKTGEQTLSVVLHDVTELRRLERIRQDFVANVSHELRTPLTSIKGFIETLLHGAIDEPEHNRQFLALVEEDVNRLARLTDDLLELSKVESFGKPKSLQAVDVPRLIHDVVESLQPQSRAKEIVVTLRPHELLPRITGDPDQIRQVLWNVLDNAIKYNVEQGRVDIELRSDGPWLYVKVTDTGIGIPADEVPRIFERFYRVDKARSRALGGTGLGLSIVKHIVEAHGGQVDVTSEPGRGSTFQFSLPCRLS